MPPLARALGLCRRRALTPLFPFPFLFPILLPFPLLPIFFLSLSPFLLSFLSPIFPFSFFFFFFSFLLPARCRAPARPRHPSPPAPSPGRSPLPACPSRARLPSLPRARSPSDPHPATGRLPRAHAARAPLPSSRPAAARATQTATCARTRAQHATPRHARPARRRRASARAPAARPRAQQPRPRRTHSSTSPALASPQPAVDARTALLCTAACPTRPVVAVLPHHQRSPRRAAHCRAPPRCSLHAGQTCLVAAASTPPSPQLQACRCCC